MKLPSLAAIDAAAEIVYKTMAPTPQFCWPLLCEETGAEVWVKHENHTPIGAFKLRGGLVYVEKLLRQNSKVQGIIAATRGNHGQSLAFAASRVGLRAVIVVPRGNSIEKNAAMRALKAELIESGNDFQESLEHAMQIAESDRLHFVPSFDETLVEGVASYGMELFRAAPNLDAVYVPIGLGSGICGTVAARNALNPQTEIIGVTAASAPAYLESFAARQPISANTKPTVADGMACRSVNAAALDLILSGVSRIVSVEEFEIQAAMRRLFSSTHNTSEGAGAAAFAALWKERELMRNRRVAVILTGGNVDRTLFADVLRESRETK
jgi:threonine dehydratase